MEPIKSILIVGGGTSGWLAAAYLSRKLGTAGQGGVEITLIEASDIPTIGVGEATIPPIRSMVAALGLSEAEFLRETEGTFKLAIRFDRWRKGRPGAPPHHFYHAFGKYGQLGHDLLAPYWLLDGRHGGTSFVDYTMVEGRLLEAGRGPRRAQDPEFGGTLDYAYHFDAGLVAQLLKKVALAHGVRHLVGRIDDTVQDEDGSILCVVSDPHGRLPADLFIDCTGFRAQLIEKTMGAPFRSASDLLFCDSAVAFRTDYDTHDAPIAPYTASTALDAGWCWHIPLQKRIGNGYVYSSRYTSKDEAEIALRRHLGEERLKDANPVHLSMRVGHREEQWRHNCIALGLSAGFVEPLESTAIYLVDIALRWLVDMFPTRETLGTTAKAFNRRISASYEDVIDFVKLHYCLSDRDEPFWRDNRRAETLPESLKHKLEMWRYRTPGQYEFGHLPAVFGLSNYLQILYGMEHYPQLDGAESRYRAMDDARRQAAQIRAIAESGVRVLPSHRDLVRSLSSPVR